MQYLAFEQFNEIIAGLICVVILRFVYYLVCGRRRAHAISGGNGRRESLEEGPS